MLQNPLKLAAAGIVTRPDEGTISAYAAFGIFKKL